MIKKIKIDRSKVFEDIETIRSQNPLMRVAEIQDLRDGAYVILELDVDKIIQEIQQLKQDVQQLKQQLIQKI